MKKKLHSPIMPFLFLAAVTTFNSCSTSDKTPEVQQGSVDMPLDKMKDSAKQTSLFSLPAPMQIATAIKKNCPGYFSELLCPLKDINSSGYAKILNLGIYAVDLGYADVYDQKQTSINYFVSSMKLADELKIIGPTDPGMIKAFKENINEADSVKHYTLRSFRNIHSNLINSNRKDEAILILTGSFIEGVYLSSMIQDKNKDKKLMHLIGEQKLFLANIITVLPRSENKDEMDGLATRLNELKMIYDKVNIAYKASANQNQKDMEPIAISDDVLKQINEKIIEIRNSIIQPKGIS